MEEVTGKQLKEDWFQNEKKYEARPVCALVCDTPNGRKARDGDGRGGGERKHIGRPRKWGSHQHHLLNFELAWPTYDVLLASSQVSSDIA